MFDLMDAGDVVERDIMRLWQLGEIERLTEPIVDDVIESRERTAFLSAAMKRLTRVELDVIENRMLDRTRGDIARKYGLREPDKWGAKRIAQIEHAAHQKLRQQLEVLGAVRWSSLEGWVWR